MSENFEDKIKDLKELLMSDEEEDGSTYLEILSNLGLDGSEFDNVTYNRIDLEYTSENYEELSYAYPTDSGFDLRSSTTITIPKFGRALIPTGIKLNIPENYEIQVRSKSGLAINQGLMVLNSPGTVDEGYTGEIKVILFNTNDHEVTVEKGMKVAQAVISHCISGKWVNLKMVDEIAKKDRNENGFGSTGI